jgi:hypothetical protein
MATSYQLKCLLFAKGEVISHLMSLSFRAWPRLFYKHELYSLWPPLETEVLLLLLLLLLLLRYIKKRLELPSGNVPKFGKMNMLYTSLGPVQTTVKKCTGQ